MDSDARNRTVRRHGRRAHLCRGALRPHDEDQSLRLLSYVAGRDAAVQAKGGIHAFTRSLATHLISRGIRVNAVAPGAVWTPSTRPTATRRTFPSSAPTRR